MSAKVSLVNSLSLSVKVSTKTQSKTNLIAKNPGSDGFSEGDGLNPVEMESKDKNINLNLGLDLVDLPSLYQVPGRTRYLLLPSNLSQAGVLTVFEKSILPVLMNGHDISAPNLALETVQKENLKKVSSPKIRILYEDLSYNQVFESIKSQCIEHIPDLYFEPYQTVFYKQVFDCANQDSNQKDFVSNKPTKGKPVTDSFRGIGRDNIKTEPEIDPQDRQKKPLNWDNYQDLGWQIVDIESTESPYWNVALDFLSYSNGSSFVKSQNGKTEIIPNSKVITEIEENLSKLFDQKSNLNIDPKTGNKVNRLFLLKNQKTGSFGGAFALSKVDGREIHLHYTSGKTQKYQLTSGPKMPIIASAIYFLMETVFCKEGFNCLSFSNRDEATAKVYQSNGFSPYSGRYCLLLKRNMKAEDML